MLRYFRTAPVVCHGGTPAQHIYARRLSVTARRHVRYIQHRAATRPGAFLKAPAVLDSEEAAVI